MNKQKIKEVAETFRTFDDIYNTIIKNGVETSRFMLDHDCIWKRLELQWLFDYFLQKEDYEKCAILKDLMVNNFIAPEDKQTELNSKLQFIK